jgi:hypothetical protein
MCHTGLGFAGKKDRGTASVWFSSPRSEIGHIDVPTPPLRIQGAALVDTVPSPKLGQHNREIYSGWLGLSAPEIARSNKTVASEPARQPSTASSLPASENQRA